jgi:hypothetical protein
MDKLLLGTLMGLCGIMLIVLVFLSTPALGWSMGVFCILFGHLMLLCGVQVLNEEA